MNITLSELIDAITGNNNSRHPLCGKSVLVVSSNGFIHAGVLDQEGSRLYLREAKNIRYWCKRDGGLPELARNGFLPDDKIDECDDHIWLESIVFITKRNPS